MRRTESYGLNSDTFKVKTLVTASRAMCVGCVCDVDRFSNSCDEKLNKGDVWRKTLANYYENVNAPC